MFSATSFRLSFLPKEGQQEIRVCGVPLLPISSLSFHFSSLQKPPTRVPEGTPVESGISDGYELEKSFSLQAKQTPMQTLVE